MGFLGILIALFCLWALRSKSVRWRFAIPLALVPILMGMFLGIFGVLIGGLYASSLWKLDLRGIS